MDYQKVSLQTLNSGAAVELFEEEFRKALENIGDPNTTPEAIREVRVVVKIKPNKDRNSAVTTVQATSKLAPCQPHESFVLFDHDGRGRVTAYSTDPKQAELEPLITEFAKEAK